MRRNREQTPYAFKTAALAKEGLIYTGTDGMLSAIYAVNNSAAAKYLQLHDAVADPGAAAVPIASVIVPAGGNASMVSVVGLNLFAATGIYWTCSTTAAVNTLSGTDDLLVWGQYYRATS